jgi:hypothetical protein
VTMDSLSQLPNVTIDRRFVSDLADNMRTLGGWLAPLIVFGSFLFYIFAYSVNLLYFVPLALFPWVIARARKLPASYGAAYRMTMHANTLPAVVNMILTDGFLVPPVPYVYPVVLLAVLFFNIRPQIGTLKPAAPAQTA